MPGKIIALVGPSGVGKNFVKQAIKNQYPELSELAVYTTRRRRPSDGLDRKTDITTEDFMKMKNEGKVIGAHQPFGKEGDWYGFSRDQIDGMLKSDQMVLTEIHPDNIQLFKKIFGDQIFAIALIAEKQYLGHNLEERNSEKPEEKDYRLDKADKEIRSIREMHENGSIDKMIKVDWDNRNELSKTVIDEISQEFNLPIANENRLKLR
jgi:guanylate kinase